MTYTSLPIFMHFISSPHPGPRLQSLRHASTRPLPSPALTSEILLRSTADRRTLHNKSIQAARVVLGHAKLVIHHGVDIRLVAFAQFESVVLVGAE